MKKISTGVLVAAIALGTTTQVLAGNKDRTGQAGASELLINPWGQSTGVFGMNTAQVRGVDAMKTNIAGLAFVNKTELGASYSLFLRGSNIGVNNLGFAQKMGKNSGTLGVNIMALSMGEITITDYNNPTGTSGVYKPQLFNMQVGYAKSFSKTIHAGVGATFVSEQISNVKASGLAFEAGIQYVTGKRDNFHFGITLRNIGTNMRFAGSGFSTENIAAQGEYSMNTLVPAEKFEMPTYLNFGVAYDFYLDETNQPTTDAQATDATAAMPKHRVTPMANFTSNSFNNDFLGLGVEYSYKEMFMLRGAYRYEKNIGTANSTTMYTGISAGATVQTRIGETGPTLAIDYSFRPTQRPATGVHVFSLRFIR